MNKMRFVMVLVALIAIAVGLMLVWRQREADEAHRDFATIDKTVDALGLDSLGSVVHEDHIEPSAEGDPANITVAVLVDTSPADTRTRVIGRLENVGFRPVEVSPGVASQGAFCDATNPCRYATSDDREIAGLIVYSPGQIMRLEDRGESAQVWVVPQTASGVIVSVSL